MITEPNVSITFRLTQEEKDLAKQVAKANHKTLSQYVRDVLRAQMQHDAANLFYLLNQEEE